MGKIGIALAAIIAGESFGRDALVEREHQIFHPHSIEPKAAIASFDQLADVFVSADGAANQNPRSRYAFVDHSLLLLCRGVPVADPAFCGERLCYNSCGHCQLNWLCTFRCVAEILIGTIDGRAGDNRRPDSQCDTCLEHFPLLRACVNGTVLADQNHPAYGVDPPIPKPLKIDGGSAPFLFEPSRCILSATN